MVGRRFLLYLTVVAMAVFLSSGISQAQPDQAGAQDKTAPAVGDAQAYDDSDYVYNLGQITVTDHREGENPVGYSVVTREELNDFSREGLVEALNIVPGVSAIQGSGNRNEALISVRGFNRWQVPLTMDGIRLYLPADNRIDFDRFLTPDLAEVQIAKGYVSVLNGPDGMGGTINLVTRKPVKPFEAEIRGSLLLDRSGSKSGNVVYGNVGSRQEKYYVQGSYEHRDTDYWGLSHDFRSTVAENGGDRDHTDKEDWRTTLKAGFTPNSTDEYSLNFMKQEGEKHGIGSVDGLSTISLWDWPKWDVMSLYYIGHTQLTEALYLKTKAYYNEFKNDLRAYTDLNLTTPNWTSYYEDESYGGSIELGTDYIKMNTLKTAFHYRYDEHTEWQKTHATNFTEPKQTAEEETFSIALEDTFHVTPKLDLIAGISYDKRKMEKAEEWNKNDGFFKYRTKDASATNYQGAVIYRYRDQGKVHASVSNRTRFPTMFERFSSRFGGALSNPGLDPEEALNFEVGVSDTFFSKLHGELTFFYNKVDDAIQSVPIFYNGKWWSQFQNVGEATFKGVEAVLSAVVLPTLELGGNYTYMDTDIDNPNNRADRLTGVPHHKFFAYGKWTPIKELNIIPSLEYATDRWSTRSVGKGYTRTGQYTLTNLKVQYQVTSFWDVSVTANNILDDDYALSDGYPCEGRNFMLATRFRF